MNKIYSQTFNKDYNDPEFPSIIQESEEALPIDELHTVPLNRVKLAVGTGVILVGAGVV